MTSIPWIIIAKRLLKETPSRKDLSNKLSDKRETQRVAANYLVMGSVIISLISMNSIDIISFRNHSQKSDLL